MHAREKPKPTPSSLEFAKEAANISQDYHARDVVILDLRAISAIADFFVIATGTSDRQMRGMVEQIETYGQQVGQSCYRISGFEAATWILVDYVDVVIHLFQEDRRRFYDLELLWGDAPRIDWHRPATGLFAAQSVR